MVKAAVLYEANKPMVIKDLHQQSPKSNEVKVKMLAAGVCACLLYTSDAADE